MYAARDPALADDPEKAFNDRQRLVRKMGWCLIALHNDVEIIQKGLESKLQNLLSNSTISNLDDYREKVFDAQKALTSGAQSWHPISLKGNAIGAPIDYRQTKEYAVDSASVAKKLEGLTKHYAPMLPSRVDAIKTLYGLKVDARDCRELFISDTSGVASTTSAVGTVSGNGAVRPVPEIRKGFCLAALRNDIEALEKHLRTLDSPPAKLKADDISTWPEPSLQGNAIGAIESVQRDIDRYLVDSYNVRHAWRSRADRFAPDLGSIVRSALTYRGLRNLISLSFEPAAVILDIGNNGNEIFQTADTKSETFAAAALALESDHFFSDKTAIPHFSFGGQIGARPVLNLLRRKPPEAPTEAPEASEASDPVEATNGSGSTDEDKPEPIFPTYQQALVWELGGRVNSAFKRVEVSGGYTVGQTFLTDDKNLVKRDDDFVGIGLKNQTSRAELFQEAYVEVRAYDVDARIIHGQNSFLNPRFNFVYGQRWNNRYRPPDDIAVSRSDWQHSQFIRFKWNIRNTIASRDRYDKPLTVTFSFGVEHEWWKRSVGLPSSTAIYFTGDFDLAKIFKTTK